MLDLIEQLNSENASEFIEKYGKIQDREIAKQMLLITTNAWLVLDDKLKRDPEIIMYYQPMGTLDYEEEGDMGGVFDTLYSAELPQKGFKFYRDKNFETYQIPNFELPEDFDIEMYIAIQSELLKNIEENYIIRDFNSEKKDMGKIMNNIIFEKPDTSNVDYSILPRGLGYEGVRWREHYIVYDRKVLYNIIQESYLNMNVRKTK